jgi:subtilisin family serine protease
MISLSFAQLNTKTYFLKISNKDYVPTIVNPNDAIKTLVVDPSLKKAKGINEIIDSFTVYDFWDLYAKAPYTDFIDTYVFTLDTLDNIDDLISSYSTIFPAYLIEQEYPPLYTPNDFENSSLMSNIRINTVSEYEQNDLKMIRAEEAWDITKGDSLVRIGIVDSGFYIDHEEFEGEFVGGLSGYINVIDDYNPNINPNSNNYKHGDGVASFASAKTDNNAGFASIGFKTKLLGARGGSVSKALQLATSDLRPKVINLSYGTDYASYSQNQQNMVNQIRDEGVVFVIAGGNGEDSGSGNPNTYYYPASYENIIAVSTVGNKNEIGSTLQSFDNWKDVHDVRRADNGQVMSHQHNDSIDIVVPAYYPSPRIFVDVVPDDPWVDNYTNNHEGDPGGTSLSAPIVAGTIGLMFSVNYCLDPKEVETILKLTAVKIDTIPENLPYYGRLGAGRLDAYEAVKMSKDMADQFGAVEVKDRILYRPWFYKLETAPYEIKMTNNDVSQGSKLKFRARNNIEILSGEYSPGTGGYVDLQIDSNLPLNDCPPPVNQTQSKQAVDNKRNERENEQYSLKVYPTLVIDDLNIEQYSKENKIRNISIKIYNFFGSEVYSVDNIISSKAVINLSDLTQGIYIVKILDNNGEVINVDKIIKK